MMKKVKIVATIDVSEDFDINDLAICKYIDDGKGTYIPKDLDFDVMYYHLIEEVK